MVGPPEYVRIHADKPGVTLSSRDLEKQVVEIWREHGRRLQRAFMKSHKHGLSKNEDAKNFLRREIYALGLRLKARPPSWNLCEVLVGLRKHQTTRRDVIGLNIFHDLLMVVYDEDDQISRQERWIMAKEMEYAHRHSVPPEFLCGFLYQSGGRKNLLEKLKDDYIEPVFRGDA